VLEEGIVALVPFVPLMKGADSGTIRDGVRLLRERVVVKIRQGVKFFYNMHPQTSGRVKGYRERVPPQVWYIAPGRRRRDFGLRQK